jgi:hypothetical protein
MNDNKFPLYSIQSMDKNPKAGWGPLWTFTKFEGLTLRGGPSVFQKGGTGF